MLKIFNDFAKARFSAQVAECFPDYRMKKSLRGPLAGALSFEFKMAPDKRGWISFGGFQEDSFAVLAAWANDTRELRELEAWDQYPNPRAYEVPPIPDCGYVDLRDLWRFEPDHEESGTYAQLEICPPPPALSAMVFERYAKSAECDDYIDRLYASMLRTHTRNPLSAEQNRKEYLDAEKYACSLLWSQLATRHTFSDEELLFYLDPVVNDAMELVRKYGIPLIATQISNDS